MFQLNKYSTWYYDIINNAKSQERIKLNFEYFENHHIIPKSMGGSNEKSNLILLTYKEHFLCHWLLTKMASDSSTKQKMYFAFFSMTRRKEKLYTSSQYAFARKLLIKARKASTISDETRAKISFNSSNISSETRGKKSNSMKKLIWITDGVNSQRIMRDTELPAGWRLGRVFERKDGFMTPSTIQKLKQSRKHTSLTFRGEEYFSLRDCERITGISRHLIKKEL